MAKDWVKIYSTDFIHLSEIAKGVLEETNIKTFLINKKDSMHTNLQNGLIELYVERENVIKAIHLISKHQL